MEILPTSLPELFKPLRTQNVEKKPAKMKVQNSKFQKSLYSMKNDGIPMIPGVEPILLDLENPFLPSRDLKNRRKTQKIEI